MDALHGRRIGRVFCGWMATARGWSGVMWAGHRGTLAGLATGLGAGGFRVPGAQRLLHGQRAMSAWSASQRKGRPDAEHHSDNQEAGADVVKTAERLPRRGQRLLHGGRPRDRQSSFRLQVPQRAAGVANGVRKEYRSLQLNTNGQRSCRMAGKCAGSFAIH